MNELMKIDIEKLKHGDVITLGEFDLFVVNKEGNKSFIAFTKLGTKKVTITQEALNKYLSNSETKQIETSGNEQVEAPSNEQTN